MEGAFIRHLEKKGNLIKGKKACSRVYLMKTEDLDFIKTTLDEKENENIGIFIFHSKKDTYHLYKCERYKKTRGKTLSDPTKTRANHCSAYISFQFESSGSLRGKTFLNQFCFNV